MSRRESSAAPPRTPVPIGCLYRTLAGNIGETKSQVIGRSEPIHSGSHTLSTLQNPAKVPVGVAPPGSAGAVGLAKPGSAGGGGGAQLGSAGDCEGKKSWIPAPAPPEKESPVKGARASVSPLALSRKHWRCWIWGREGTSASLGFCSQWAAPSFAPQLLGRQPVIKIKTAGN